MGVGFYKPVDGIMIKVKVYPAGTGFVCKAKYWKSSVWANMPIIGQTAQMEIGFAKTSFDVGMGTADVDIGGLEHAQGFAQEHAAHFDRRMVNLSFYGADMGQIHCQVDIPHHFTEDPGVDAVKSHQLPIFQVFKLDGLQEGIRLPQLIA